MGELVQFPDRSSQDPEKPLNARAQGENLQLQVVDGPWLQVDINCQGHIHIFGDVPGSCRCGENYWGDDILPEPPAIGIHEV